MAYLGSIEWDYFDNDQEALDWVDKLNKIGYSARYRGEKEGRHIVEKRPPQPKHSGIIHFDDHGNITRIEEPEEDEKIVQGRALFGDSGRGLSTVRKRKSPISGRE